MQSGTIQQRCNGVFQTDQGAHERSKKTEFLRADGGLHQEDSLSPQEKW